LIRILRQLCPQAPAAYACCATTVTATERHIDQNSLSLARELRNHIYELLLVIKNLLISRPLPTLPLHFLSNKFLSTPFKADAAVLLSKLIPSVQNIGPQLTLLYVTDQHRELAIALHTIHGCQRSIHNDYLEPDHLGLER